MNKKSREEDPFEKALEAAYDAAAGKVKTASGDEIMQAVREMANALDKLKEYREGKRR